MYCVQRRVIATEDIPDCSKPISCKGATPNRIQKQQLSDIQRQIVQARRTLEKYNCICRDCGQLKECSCPDEKNCLHKECTFNPKINSSYTKIVGGKKKKIRVEDVKTDDLADEQSDSRKAGKKVLSHLFGKTDKGVHKKVVNSKTKQSQKKK